uniref:Putative lipopolysaccharide biosynthesis protein LicD n=1 Tax=uncultured bacterium fosmid pJB135F11 TaxID=1478051 RepID=A0A0H3UAV7_9BACT|nr:putative lipopolysaccharide biosynthesis protein LicD [uncultured bacterium fosmid pJB135F11]
MNMNNLEKYLQDHLSELQHKELEILCAIKDVCEKNGIEYWLDGGTCLGAVRHQGFIPWDDDIDIAMRKDDLPRFVEAAKRDLPDGLFVQTMDTDPSCRLPIVKVRDMNSLIVEFGDDFRRNYQKGIFVDIFPMIPYPDVSHQFCKKIVKEYCRANAILKQQHTYSWRSVAELFGFGGKRILCAFIWRVAQQLLPCKTYFSNTIETNGYGIMHRADTIFPTSKILFEGEEFTAPAHPEQYLCDLYGDYLQLPPMEKRKGHAAFYKVKLV